jgi:SlyX protein
MSESAIVELEIKLTYLEETVGELNHVVYQQQKTLDQLTDVVKKLSEQVKTLQEQQPASKPEDERPPHY